MVTYEEAKELLQFDPISGEFTWLKSPNPKLKVGQKAGSTKPDGYKEIKLFGRIYKSHRLAWLINYGSWPEKEIDHIDGDKGNNRMSNLREASHSENGGNRGRNRNNSSGLKGVTWDKPCNKWRAQIGYGNQIHYLGVYASKEEAYKVYEAKSTELFGEFSRVE